MILLDYLQPGLRILFVGTAVGTRSAERGHYYAGPGNDFYRFLHDASLTPIVLTPDDDATLPTYRLGLTDLTKTVAQSHDRGLTFDFPSFTAKIAKYRPGIVAFTSKEAGKVYARHLGERAPGFGPTPWTIAGQPGYVLPSPSGANRTVTDPPRVEWWRRLQQFAS